MEIIDWELFYILFEGVESEYCVMIVDNGLKELEGVIIYKVELNNNCVIINEIKVFNILLNVVKVICDLGYGVIIVKKNFLVLNMMCVLCVISV